MGVGRRPGRVHKLVRRARRSGGAAVDHAAQVRGWLSSAPIVLCPCALRAPYLQTRQNLGAPRLRPRACRMRRDKEVRLFAACILADLMRVYAPDAPYDDDTFKVPQLCLPASCLPELRSERWS